MLQLYSDSMMNLSAKQSEHLFPIHVSNMTTPMESYRKSDRFSTAILCGHEIVLYHLWTNLPVSVPYQHSPGSLENNVLILNSFKQENV